ncbi:sulfatase [Niabella aurantiaca]|uniref:sulfatase n=1 Tax=Niabella aurantiaca TaxID=379900 RepID=UPI0003635DFF|nr:sulfatase [Niabella aurantiaca]
MTRLQARRNYLFFCALLLVIAQEGFCQDRPPNVVFFLVDDMGWKDLHCYGSSFYDTPHIDALAAQSVRFTSAYASAPVCSPARSGIMTGKYPVAMQTTDWFGAVQPEDAAKETRKEKITRLLPASYRNYLPQQEVTLAEAFKKAGYATFLAGKWHLGSVPQNGPLTQGFDHYFEGKAKSPSKGSFGIVAEANRFIEQNRAHPFLAFVSFYAVHIPVLAGEKNIARYTAKKDRLKLLRPVVASPWGRERVKQDHERYAAMVFETDSAVGLVLSKLKELQLDRNTIVVFLSDNGGLSTAEGMPTANRPLRGGKGWLYEGGIRVPLLLKWPAMTQPGTVVDAPVVNTDLYPTLLALAGLPQNHTQHKDGVNLLPRLAKKEVPERSLYWHYPHYGNQKGSPASAIRSGNWKLIYWYEDQHCELYNLKEDQSEAHDLAPVKKALTKKLKADLQAWLKKEGAIYPVVNPAYNPM